MTKRILVTGCAGFIGSNLVDHLLSHNNKVIGVDNFSTGKMQFLTSALSNSNFLLYKHDLFDPEKLPEIFENIDIVYHLAANADIRFGMDNPRRDLEQNTLVTHNVLEAMRKSSVKQIVFSSTGAIYGNSVVTPTPENAPFPIQTSLYGASKLACESLIQAYCEAFDFQSWIFRFVSILGPRYSHGHVIDFYTQLFQNPEYLKILGNGHQRKSYLHVSDCIDGIETALKNCNEIVNIFNLGVDGTCEVRDSIEWINEKLKLNPKLDFGVESQGWIGDNALIHLEISKMSALGWKPKFSIQESIESTLDYLEKNKWLLAITD